MAPAADFTAPPEELIHLIIRFTASIADVSLSISSPRTTTTLNLKRLIREHLSPSFSSNRLRLIYAGKVLPDTAPLHISLNLGPQNRTAQRAAAAAQENEGTSNDKRSTTSTGTGKGKAALRGDSGPGPPPRRLYIHCSIGDALTPSDLASEARGAEEAQAKLVAAQQRKSTASTSQPPSPTAQEAMTSNGSATGSGSASTAPAPRGFDRLAATGFTRDDIQSLRRSFLAQLSMDHTPETMPTGSALLTLEDRWLDSTVNADTLIADTDGMGMGMASVDEDVEADQLENMFWGNMWGFFCPLLAIVWGFREDGVWTRRRQIAVLTGIIINLVFGFARLSS